MALASRPIQSEKAFHFVQLKINKLNQILWLGMLQTNVLKCNKTEAVVGKDLKYFVIFSIVVLKNNNIELSHIYAFESEAIICWNPL